MKKRQLELIGFEGKAVLDEAVRVCSISGNYGFRGKVLKQELKSLSQNPDSYLSHELFGPLADLLIQRRNAPSSQDAEYKINEFLKYQHWGDEIDEGAHTQMRNACSLPVSVKAALMPDAHVGYGLPIGGVLAVKDAVIPYAVGVDIACRVKLTVLETPLSELSRDIYQFKKAIDNNTRFGMGAKWRDKKQHHVMDMDWNANPVTKRLKDIAWSQLGTSGSGNHFVEFGEITFDAPHGNLPAGTYLGLVSHSGSRGPGARVADHYSKLAAELHPKLPKHLRHLSWLPLNAEGAEYWQAMELMGAYASANHEIIHRGILRSLNARPILQIENHHNYAWKEVHDGKQLIVHRKGATPAGKGELGYIPGSMTAPGYLVEGLGSAESLNSASHGAGRQMSRKAAKTSTTRYALNKILRDQGVELMSAGLDESPHAYKDIDAVMRAQRNLVRAIAKFQPRLVKMAPEGERPED